MLKSIKIRLYPTGDQQDYINNLLGCYRKVYNLSLNYKIEQYKLSGETANMKSIGHEFHNIWTKSDEYSYLNNHNTKVLKQSIINVLDAYKRFFINGSGFPKFKSKHDNKQSCRFVSEAISIRNDYTIFKLTLTKELKNIKFSCSVKYSNYLQKYKENIRSATLTKTKSGSYYLSILVDGSVDKVLDKPLNDVLGIDLGIKSFIVDSRGNEYQNIKIKRNNLDKLSKLHRELSRKEKGSKNRTKARIKLARFYERLDNIKQEYLHSITNKLLNENQVLTIEDLNVKGLLKNHNMAMSIQELSLFDFKQKLIYKSKWYNRLVIEIDRFYPSSKTCSHCGYKNDKLTLNDRTWRCPNCGTTHNRDHNAAINIENEGRKIFNNKIPTRCGKFTPLDTSGYAVDELGNDNPIVFD